MIGDKFYVDRDGVILGFVWKPLSSVGIYVPGSEATYLSSMFMNAIPARLAGVKHIYICVWQHPIIKSKINVCLMVCTSICEIKYIYTFLVVNKK